jgi:soluble cytochrome b562
METASTEVEPKLRKYQHVWQKIIATPEKTVKVKATHKSLLPTIRKAVWKEKDRDLTKTPDGKYFRKDLWILTVEIDEKNLFLLFKLKATNHPANV